MHVESAIKANALGIEMNRKVKRLGCSGLKDLLENKKLNICDENTISEMSTFVARGQSYEANIGNHDDLVMNFVMFGYFVTTEFFTDMTNINLKQILFDQKIQEIEEDVVPFGFIDDGQDFANESEKPNWYIEYDV